MQASCLPQILPQSSSAQGAFVVTTTFAGCTSFQPSAQVRWAERLQQHVLLLRGTLQAWVRQSCLGILHLASRLVWVPLLSGGDGTLTHDVPENRW